MNLRTEVNYDGLNFPSSMAFLGIDDILVSEKNTGLVKRITNGKLIDTPVLDVQVANKGERGLLGIAVDRSQSNQTYVFLYFTESSTHTDGDDVTSNKEPVGNRLYRYSLVDNKLVDPILLLDIQASTTAKSKFHNGGKIVIGPDNDLYLTVGNIQRNSQALNNKTGSQPRWKRRDIESNAGGQTGRQRNSRRYVSIKSILRLRNTKQFWNGF